MVKNTNKENNMKTIFKFNKIIILMFFGFALTMLLVGGVQANPLNTTQTPLNLMQVFPDFLAGGLDLRYTGNTLTLTDNDSSYFNYSPDGTWQPDLTGTFDYNLVANFNGSGLFSDGSLTITRDSNTYLNAHLTNFGFFMSGSAGIFEFTGNITAKDASVNIGPGIGIIAGSFDISPGHNPGDFSGTADVDPFTTSVPEPSTILLLSLGISFLLFSMARMTGKQRN